MKINTKLRNDLILAVVLLIIALILFSVFKSNLKIGNKAIIQVDGKELYSLNLNEDISKTVTTSNGKNTVEIKNGTVSIISADCPDKICANHRPISKVGETIICLPHKLVVEIAEG